ncbi:DUF2510 domain-containing protein [Mycobacterium yunnanensis]|uniref:DUF2510 domain-containing protein n=1 Tax=Mycobacterium yunnanensis TaxID=368477 RepID=A0A9X2Z406_9MYCO|nr:DUF2510 domain-containing protein [Mycobacterium yunnanensis]MCV7421472.1 DUF2510 domain-containing protein [Mycobacterium yunnanensis]
MTTPLTPANWYPDPEDPNVLRYWDGWAWTEHRAPAPDATNELAATEAGEPDAAPEGVQEQPVQPYDTHPPAAAQQTLLDEDDPWNPPLPSWDSLSTEPLKTEDPETPGAPPTSEMPEAPAPEASSQPEATAVEPANFAPPPGPPPGYYPPPTPPPGGTSNRKLVIGVVAGVLLLVVIAVVVALVTRTDEPAAAPSVSTSSSSEPSPTPPPSDSPTAEATPTESLTPPPPGAEGKDGDYTFAVAGTETGDTITSPAGDAVRTAADGTYYVVYLDVTNTGAAPLTFVANFQQLNASGQTFPLDEEATAFLGGTVADIVPGEQKKTPLVYGVPVGTEPGSIVLHADPSTPGVELPLR